MAVFVLAVALVVVGVVVYRLTSTTQWVAQTVPGPMGSNDLVGITCSHQSECIIQADNDQLLGSNDGGSNWAIAQSISGPLDAPNGMACDGDGCVAAVSVDGGVQGQFFGLYGDLGWGTASGVFPFRRPTLFTNGHMSCTSSGDFCALIVNEPGVGGTDMTLGSAQTWISRPFVENNDTDFNPVSTMPILRSRPQNLPESPSCPIDNRCFAFGGGTVWQTVDGGIRWRVVFNLPPRQLTSFTSIACFSASQCMVGTESGSVAVTENGGRSWAVRKIPGWCPGSLGSGQCASVVGISCVSTLSCYVASGDVGGSYESQIDTTTNGGRTWSSMSLPSPVSLNDLACSHQSDCWAVGSTVPSSNSSSPVILHLG